jgi:DNA (cytosine-5)-methyltransferase 1
MPRPKLLDLFCGAGGAAMGYYQAGFDVVGVDINPQPHYPFVFRQAEAMTFSLEGFDAIHASPPCQSYTQKQQTWGRARTLFREHPDLLAPTRARLQDSHLPYIIENVPGAPMSEDFFLCGTMFGLRIVKHRYFESNFPLIVPPTTCDHSDVFDPWHGKGRTAAEHRAAQGTPWIPVGGGTARLNGVTGDLNNAIPPAYTEYLGSLLLTRIHSKVFAS